MSLNESNEHQRTKGSASPKQRLVKNLLCKFGIHKRDKNWCLKWSSKRYYCKCGRCGRYMPKGSLKTYSEDSFYKYF